MKRTSTQAGFDNSKKKKQKVSQGGVIWAPNVAAVMRAKTITGELKNIDTNPINFPAFGATSGSLTLLNGATQGSGSSNRIGRRITMKSILMRGRILVAATTTGASPIRIIIFYDKQANGAAPTASDLLTGDSISDMNNLGNSRRFQVLMDEVRECVGTAGPQSVYIQRYLKCDLVTEFNTGNAGTVADIATGSLYALAYASPGIQVASLTCNVQTRVRFLDN